MTVHDKTNKQRHIFTIFQLNKKCFKIIEDQLLFNDFENVKLFLKRPLRNLYKIKNVTDKYKKTFLHMDPHSNEIMFIKRNDKSCCGDY